MIGIAYCEVEQKCTRNLDARLFTVVCSMVSWLLAKQDLLVLRSDMKYMKHRDTTINGNAEV